ncbi:T6SS phospholipase effector Tle1-like catalytic domain-containing protein (plasmid) [Ralstonia sp. 25C]|uniref:T6SS phospholipase effector Tle1-like catalytic domain-containing protein n=1 Tax=Ralstonia sp. 25C TaxID=3447363 RepID=UPI003F7503E2
MTELERLEPNPFALTANEKGKCTASNMDAFSGACTQEFRIAFFFDGTNNNKDRDTPRQAHSNVARLFDIFEVTADQVRFYVPGIGTPFQKEIGDTGRGYDARAGLGSGWGGEARINWALLKLTDAVYGRYLGDDLSKAMGTDDLALVKKISTDVNLPVHTRASAGSDEIDELNNASTTGTLFGTLDMAALAPNHDARRQELARRREFVAQKVKPLIDGRKPTLTRIRLYVFGFSRGAAEARVFCSWLEDALGKDMTLAGVKVSVDFLGIFDTVASVGFAQSFMIASGHGGWGGEEFLRIPHYVERTVHLISSHEIRGSFPLDKAASKNCLELAYPGVHTDVGGAYQPGDQGRGCRADGTPDDSTKMSQVTLAKMYREAVAAGVPLNPAASNLAQKFKDALRISPQLIKDYNNYVDAVNPLIRKQGGGTTGAAHVQYGLYLRWRRLRLGTGAQAFENQPFFKRAQKFSAQCAQDLAGANEELREEAKIMAEKENSLIYSDSWMGRVFQSIPGTVGKITWVQQFVWGEKVKQWKQVKPHWNDTSPLDARIIKFFDDYVHDSRAWFKPTGATNEQVWKQRQRERLEELKQKDAKWKAQWAEINAASERDPVGTLKRYSPVDEGGQGDMYPPVLTGEDRADLDRYLKDGSLPLEKKGREFSSVWGYLRWRTHFAQEPTMKERAHEMWDKASKFPGKVADKVTEKAKDVAHSAEEKAADAAQAAGKVLEAGKDSVIRGAKDAVDRLTKGGIPTL